MTQYVLSEKIKLILEDGNEVWPTTVGGHFRISSSGLEKIGKSDQVEHNSCEKEMINAVLNQWKYARWRSKNAASKDKPNLFSIHSPAVKEVFINVGDTWVKYK